MKFAGLLLLTAYFLTAVRGSDKRKKKLLGLFNIVSFPNEECSSGVGVCFSESDCILNGGTIDGKCASGFGVCCVFSVSFCGSSVTRNVTFIQNPGYPSGITSGMSCAFTFQRINDNICQLRLDFIDLKTVEPDNGICGRSSAGVDGGGDEITLTSPSGFNPPGSGGLCGDNLSGQHIYVEFGSGKSITWSIDIGTDTTVIRRWNIKGSQIECDAPYKAPNGCIQYFTGVSGTISSYNRKGARMISGQNYENCIRQEEGYCAIEYRSNFFTLINSPAAIVSQTVDPAPDGTVCAQVAVIIKDAVGSMTNSYCGGVFSTGFSETVNGVVRTESVPFRVGVTTGDVADTTSQGFELIYNQIPCI